MKTAAQVVSKNIAIVQTAMDVAGMIPGIGEAFDVASGMISLARGDYAGAALSMASAIPIVGNIAGAAKIANRVDDVVGLVKASDNVPASLLKGEANTHVYLGIKNEKEIYAGISVDVPRRQAQHGSDVFDYLDPITEEPVTRRQARAIEQALIEANPNFINKINSISPDADWYDDAVDWGNAWLNDNGYLP